MLENDVAFLAKRYRETHDLVHVLTGYATDVVGELEVQAFMLGNLGVPTAALILLFGALRVVPGLPQRRALLRKLRAAFRRGRRAEKLLRPWYEERWDVAVDVLRGELSISPRV